MRVILAEDSGVTRRLFASVITERGHEVTAVADGLEAWQAFERAPAPLVVLDWLLPSIDGLEVCRRIRASEAGRATFVLVATGRGSGEDVATALDAGADDFLAKPVAPEHLRARLAIAERRINQDAERRDAVEALARAQWLAGIGQTTLSLQHEINNPLAALLWEAELLASDPAAPEPLLPSLNSIAAQARRVAAVVSRLARLQDPRTVEYVHGRQMLDLANRDEP